jgi:hypothetical protein
MRSKSERPKHASVYLRDIVPGSTIPPGGGDLLAFEATPTDNFELEANTDVLALE